MEQIVRPFQTSNALKTRTLKTSIATADDTVAHLCWGDLGQVPDAVEQDDDFDGLNFRVIECDNDYIEKTRTSRKIRVENPNDPEQYVMVEQIQKIQFKNESKKEQLTSFLPVDEVFPDPDPFAGSRFENVAKKDSCRSTYHLNR